MIDDAESRDVRMRGFARRATVDEALSWLGTQLARLPEQWVPIEEAAGRVLARDVISRVNVPGFQRAMMDGFAVRAADTLGASSYNRLPLLVVGQSLPGRPPEGRVGPGAAVRIMTGAPLPDGADAVLPAELVEAEGDRILVHSGVPPAKNVGRVGEDIARGTTVLPAGRVLRPQDIGLLASIGGVPQAAEGPDAPAATDHAHRLPAGKVPVVQRPGVRIVVTGNELLAAGAVPEGFRIVDSNGPMLAALVRRDGGVPVYPGIVPDEPDAILAAMRGVDLPLPSAEDLCTRGPWPAEAGRSLLPSQIILVSGGSSVGQEDHAPVLLRKHGQLPIHGIAMRPSSPTGMGTLDGRLVFLLPGNPVSCLCAYDFFAGRAVRAFGGRSPDWPYRPLRAPLSQKIVSVVGRVDYVRVRVVQGYVEPLAVAGASSLSSTTRADGFVLVPGDSEGYAAGAEVEVYLYD